MTVCALPSQPISIPPQNVVAIFSPPLSVCSARRELNLQTIIVPSRRSRRPLVDVNSTASIELAATSLISRETLAVGCCAGGTQHGSGVSCQIHRRDFGSLGAKTDGSRSFGQQRLGVFRATRCGRLRSWIVQRDVIEMY